MCRRMPKDGKRGGNKRETCTYDTLWHFVFFAHRRYLPCGLLHAAWEYVLFILFYFVDLVWLWLYVEWTTLFSFLLLFLLLFLCYTVLLCIYITIPTQTKIFEIKILLNLVYNVQEYILLKYNRYVVYI